MLPKPPSSKAKYQMKKNLFNLGAAPAFRFFSVKTENNISPSSSRLFFFSYLILVSVLILSTPSVFGQEQANSQVQKSELEIATKLFVKAKGLSHVEAVGVLNDVLRIRERTLESTHSQLQEVVTSLAHRHLLLREYASAEGLYQRALDICEKRNGASHPDTLVPIDNLSRCYRMQSKYSLAVPLYQRSLSIREKTLGVVHVDTLKNLDDLAFSFSKQGEFSKAHRLYRQRLQVCEKAFGTDSKQLIELLSGLARSCFRQGEFAKAEPYFQRVAKIYENKVGLEHPDTIQSLKELATCYHRQLDLVGAERTYEKIVKILDVVKNSGDLDIPGYLHTVAEFYRYQGKHLAAEPLYLRSLELTEKKDGPSHPRTAARLGHLASFYNSQGNYFAAEPLLQRAFDILKENPANNDNELANAMYDLGSSFSQTGRDLQAMELFRDALKIKENIYGSDSEETVGIRGWVSTFYSNSFGEYQKAIELQKTNLEITRGIYSESSREYALQLAFSLGVTYWKADQFENSVECFQKSLKIAAKQSDGMPDDAVNIKHNLAGVLEEMGRLEEAKRLQEECLKLRLSRYGETHHQTIASLSALAKLHAKLGHLTDAETFGRRWFENAEKTNDSHLNNGFMLGKILAKCGKLDEAERYFKQDVDRASRIIAYDADRADADVRLADFYAATDQFSKAIAAQDAARKKVTRYATRRLPMLTGARRKKYLYTEYRPGFEKALSLGLIGSGNARAATLSAGWLLNGKSLTQEVLAEASLLSSPTAAPIVNELRGIRQRLSNIGLQGEPSTSESRANVSELESRLEILQSELAELGLGSSSRQDWVRIGTLMTNLPQDSCFISLARFRVHDFNATFDSHERAPESVWKSSRYAAWIVPPIGSGDVVCVDLGVAKPIDEAIAAISTSISKSGRQLEETDEKSLTVELKKKMRELSEMVFTPLTPHLQEYKKLVISPDGNLWSVPWESLLIDDGKSYLVESFQVRYVSSGRELVNPIAPRSVVGDPAIFANPNFEINGEERDLKPDSQPAHSGSSDRKFAPLVFSAAEARAIRPAIKSYVGKEPRVFTATKAQESTFKQLHRPQVLAVSTHGYFEENERIGNPLLRCGLAFSGANNREHAIGKGREDGILTGLEIVGIDLRGTELVVLSACETGVGDIQNGEGVAGLRQAFQLAGAQSVVSSLWQVEDGETARLMNLFFDNLAKGLTKSKALRQAQLSRIKARRARHGAAHPFFWAAFTLTGQD